METQPSTFTSETGSASAASPQKLLQLAMGFWASKTLLSAVELDLFTILGSGPRTAPQLMDELQLHPRSAHDFLDALVALGLLDRDDGLYRNSAEAGAFLDRAKPGCIAGFLLMTNNRLYPFWGALTEALRTGLPQNEAKQGGDPFQAIYRDERGLREFLGAMSGVSLDLAKEIAQKFPWQNYRTVVDVGTAQGALVVEVARTHEHLAGIGFDLAAVAPVFNDYVAANELQDRIHFHPGDFFKDALPSADVLVMGHILHDWNLEQKRELLARSYQALPTGGSLIVYDAVIDDERRRNAFGLMMSLNMLIETPGGFDYTARQCREWMSEAGFREIRVEPLGGQNSMIIGVR
ncbi:acetylserotonin O-methyltransferase [Paraburkholderia sp. CNPSo 3274]|uniref:acetylserotonin O-methyltransferase n=1 Tax=Paraburkholderia sp. CNPSo 3274 TaxID=2940932 RepID=UPI0020B7E9B8|nr:acetylserotonin O-methyltransferase [Paraburkholderia sp. CNPSo 3274]MCP3709949.1 acetylserotonin O-methyltransferase [Paraburkholderia sp. CNPSo 3274]